MTLLKEYSYKQGAALSVGATFIWKIFSFVNSILIAYYFGTQTRSDIYFYVISIAGTIIFFFNSLNNNVLIPQAIFLRKNDEDSAKNFLNLFLLLYLLILTIAILICFIFPIDIFKIISNFSVNILNQDILILRLAFLYFFSYVLCSFILNIMYIYRIFSINILFPLNALLPMSFLILFHNTLGLKTMLIGFITSHFIQIFICFYTMKKKLNWNFSHFKISIEQRFKNNFITNQLLVIIDCMIAMLPVYLMSSFSKGIISALSYSKQLMDAPSEIVSTKIIQVYHIQLNENASTKDFNALNANYLKINYLILFIIVPLSLFTCYFAPDIIDLFFKRGKFDTESANNVVLFLRPMMIVLIIDALFSSAGNVIASTRKIKESFKYMLLKAIISLIIIYSIISYFGPFSYPYAHICYSLLTYLILSVFFKKYIPQINFWQPLKYSVLLISLNLIALIPSAFVAKILQNQNVFIKIFLCGIIFLFVLTLLYIPTKQFKKILPPLLGLQYKTFLNKTPNCLKKFI